MNERDAENNVVELMYPRLGYAINGKGRQDLKEQALALLGEWMEAITHMDKYMELDLESLEYKHREKDGEQISHKCLSGIHYIVNNWPEDRNRGLVVQAGGNLGIWPKALGHYFQWVYTFDPAKYIFPFLAMNCPEDNILKFQMALGNVTKGVSMITGGHAASTCVAEAGKGKINKVATDFVPADGGVPMMKVDDMNLSACDAIILDVEKAELIILQGALETIRKFRPVYILTEDNPNDPETCENLKAFLAENGYEFVMRKSKDNIYKHVEYIKEEAAGDE